MLTLVATGETAERIGAAVRQLLGGMTQAELARRLNVDSAVISRWVNGRAPFDHEDVARIEEALGVTPGSVAILAGYYDPTASTTVQVALLNDPDLDPEDRQLLIGLYERARLRGRADGDGITDDP